MARRRLCPRSPHQVLAPNIGSHLAIAVATAAVVALALPALYVLGVRGVRHLVAVGPLTVETLMPVLGIYIGPLVGASS